MATTPGLGITELSDQQAGAETTYNEGIRLLEVMAGRTVKDRDLSTPPGSPSDGDAYIVKATGAGDWTSMDNKVAVYSTDQWKFITQAEGNSVYLQDENVDVLWNGSAWLAHGGYQTLTSAGTISWDASKGSNADLVLASAEEPEFRGMAAPTNLHTGWLYSLKVTQPAAGEGYNRILLTWDAIYNWAGGSQTLTNGADATDMFTWIYDGTKLQQVSAVLALS